MRRGLEAMGIAGLMALAAPWATAAPPTYPCYRPAAAPVLDGDVDGDPAWRGIPAVTGFSVLGDGYAASKQTVARACWDGEAIYVAMVCEDPDVAALKTTTRDGGNFWEDDGAEIFLRPGPTKPVLQFGVTAAGARGAFEGAADFTRFQTAAKPGADTYALEVRIPFALLGGAPRQGDTWFGDFCRNIWTTISGGDRFTCWAPLKTRFNEPENFATITFEGAPPSGAAEAAALEERLNAGYRAYLTGRLKAGARDAGEYVPLLEEAARDTDYGKRAGELLGRWRQVEASVKRADETPIVELRRMAAGLDALARASYELKWDYLIAKLPLD